MTEPGLCGRCAYARRIATRTGSVFWLCGRAAGDARFERYPRLPVRHCPGFEAPPSERGGAPSSGGDRPGEGPRP